MAARAAFAAAALAVAAAHDMAANCAADFDSVSALQVTLESDFPGDLHHERPKRVLESSVPVLSQMRPSRLAPLEKDRSKDGLKSIANTTAGAEASDNKHARMAMRTADAKKEGGRAMRKNHVDRWSQRLVNYDDIEYTALLNIGGQPIRAILDTGSVEMLVFSKHCQSWSCRDNPKYFDDTITKSFKRKSWTRTHSFGSGECVSQMATDQLSMGPYKLPSQYFWEVTSADMPILQDGSFEAIVGMGYPNGPRTEARQFLQTSNKLLAEYKTTGVSVPSWLTTQLKDDKDFADDMETNPSLLDNLGVTVFSVCFLRDLGSDGFITWNDFDPQLYPQNFQHIAVTGKSTWSAYVTDVRISGGAKSSSKQVACGKDGKKCAALIDTGSSLLAAPSHVIDDLLEELNNLGLAHSDCRNLHQMPDLVFNLGGAKIVMPPESYIGQVQGELPTNLRQYFPHLAKVGKDQKARSGCTLLMMTMNVESENNHEVWNVGMPFFREYYSSFSIGKTISDPTRGIYVAPSNKECRHPVHLAKDGEAQKTVFARSRSPLRVLNVSRVRVPSWMRRATRTGLIQL